MSRTVALLFAIVLVLASCSWQTGYEQNSFMVECREAGGKSLVIVYDGKFEEGCSGLRNALVAMNCGQAGADEAIRQLNLMDAIDDLDFDAIEDLC